MADEKPTPKPAPKKDDRASHKDAPDMSPSDAEAPGPITPEHESGSWEQTLDEQDARADHKDARGK